MAKDIPTVSAILLCRNEKDHIETCVHSVLSQEPPDGGIEFIVVDGMSEDGTRDILLQICEEDDRLHIVDNPGRVTPCGMNAGIRAARGRYIAILGTHTQYAVNYLKTCVDILEEHPEICCSGGPIISQGKGLVGRAIAIAMSHPLGIGNAKHRRPGYEDMRKELAFQCFEGISSKKLGSMMKL